MTAVYIFATVFGVGVFVVDFFLMMSSGGDEADSSDTGHSGSESDDSSADSDGDDSSGDHHGHVEHNGSVITHQQVSSKGNVILKMLGFFRNAVYFCVGFGPAGWLADSVFNERFSFLWAIGVGFIVVGIASLFRRIRREKLDSSIEDAELLLEKAIVLVSVGPNKMGKVRIAHGGLNIDRYAIAKSDIDEFYVGEEVRVCEIKDEFVIIEPTI